MPITKEEVAEAVRRLYAAWHTRDLQTIIALVLQLYLERWYSAALIVAALGNGLMPSPPPRPPEHLRPGWHPPPYQPPQQTTDLRDRQRQ